MAATTVTGDEATPVFASRASFAKRITGPFRTAHGVQRFMLWTGLIGSIGFVFTAVFAGVLAPYGFAQYKGPGGDFPIQGPPSAINHWGTTINAFDVMSRTIYGARTALEVMILAVVFSLVIGVPLGLVSGYVGGWTDRILVLINDALFAFPYLLLAIVASFLLKNTINNGIVTAAIAITVVYIPQYFRVVRASTLSAREATYVEAARAMGAKPSSIIRRYLFANVVQSVPVIATLNAADAVLTLAGLGFLGLGIQPDQAAEWGYDLNRAVADAGAGIWWTALYPGMAIVLSVTALTLVGEGLNDVLNPSLRGRHGRGKQIPIQNQSSAVGPASAPWVEEDVGR